MGIESSYESGSKPKQVQTQDQEVGTQDEFLHVLFDKYAKEKGIDLGLLDKIKDRDQQEMMIKKIEEITSNIESKIDHAQFSQT